MLGLNPMLGFSQFPMCHRNSFWPWEGLERPLGRRVSASSLPFTFSAAGAPLLSSEQTGPCDVPSPSRLPASHQHAEGAKPASHQGEWGTEGENPLRGLGEEAGWESEAVESVPSAWPALVVAKKGVQDAAGEPMSCSCLSVHGQGRGILPGGKRL